MKLHHIPLRLATGAFIFNSGLQKWGMDEEAAAGTQGMAAGAYPFLKSLEPKTFGKLLSGGEMFTGALLLAPFVPASVAGAALTAFSSSLLGMYMRIPDMRQPGSLAPSEAGTAVAKDVWMFGIGTSLIIDDVADRQN